MKQLIRIFLFLLVAHGTAWGGARFKLIFDNDGPDGNTEAIREIDEFIETLKKSFNDAGGNWWSPDVIMDEGQWAYYNIKDREWSEDHWKAQVKALLKACEDYDIIFKVTVRQSPAYLKFSWSKFIDLQVIDKKGKKWSISHTYASSENLPDVVSTLRHYIQIMISGNGTTQNNLYILEEEQWTWCNNYKLVLARLLVADDLTQKYFVLRGDTEKNQSIVVKGEKPIHLEYEFHIDGECPHDCRKSVTILCGTNHDTFDSQISDYCKLIKAHKPVHARP
jgi:hypothetical protein